MGIKMNNPVVGATGLHQNKLIVLNQNISKTLVSVKDICEARGITHPGVFKLANKKGLKSKPITVNGISQAHFYIEDLYSDKPEILKEIYNYLIQKIQTPSQPGNAGSVLFCQEDSPESQKPQQGMASTIPPSPAAGFSLDAQAETPYCQLSEEEKVKRDAEVIDKAHITNVGVYHRYIDFFNYAGRNDDVLSTTTGVKELFEQYIKEYPDRTKPKWRSYYDAWKLYKEYGAMGIMGEYGTQNIKRKVKEEWLLLYCGQLAKQSKISKQEAYNAVEHWVYNNDKDYDKETFPSKSCFEREVKSKKYARLIETLRNGRKKDGQTCPYIPTTKEGMSAFYEIVADHSWLDVPVILPDGSISFELCLTAYMDMASTKFVGWDVHIDPPNLNHINKAFYNACTHLGYKNKGILPKISYQDNGKDFLSKSVTGGRKKQLLRTFITKDEQGNKQLYTIDEKTTALMKTLGVEALFCKHYNGKAKPIEYYFGLIQKRWSAKQPGYRGNKPENRPDNLEKDIKAGKIKPLTLNEAIKSFNDFIINDFNKDECTIERKKYDSRDQAFELLFTEPRFINLDILEKITGRRSLKKTDRNGITDYLSGKKVTVYGDCLLGEIPGKPILIIYSLDETKAVLYDPQTFRPIGEAEVIGDASRLLGSKCLNLKKHSQRVGRYEKTVKGFKKSLPDISYEEQVANKRKYTAEHKKEREIEKPNQVIERVKTNFDDCITQLEKIERKAELRKNPPLPDVDVTIPIKRPKKFSPFDDSLEVDYKNVASQRKR